MIERLLQATVAIGLCFGCGWNAQTVASEPLVLGGDRELFVDGRLVDALDGARLKLHAPQAREVVFRFDQPWEGLYCGYETVLRDGDIYRLYYRGLPVAKHTLDTEVTCVAESVDGVHWTRPDLSQYTVGAAAINNVVLAHNRGCHNFAPFIDTNPDCPPEERYKALGGTGKPGLLAFVSPDGLHWTQVQDEPVITEGAFDSQNNACWSEVEECYVCFFRVFREGKRWIARTTSRDFVHWTEPVDLEPSREPREHLYTNQLAPYARAPQLYLGLATRFMPGRRVLTKAEAERVGTPEAWNYANDCTDIVLISARDGVALGRSFMEAFIRPGGDLENWTSRANYAARGMLQTGPRELSMYVKHHSGYPSAHLRRYTIRPDGFVSVHAPYDGGSLITKPFTFVGNELRLNYATSAAGEVRVEIQSVDGEVIPGWTIEACDLLIGDRLDHSVRWNGDGDLSELAGKTIRLRFEMRDADLYALRFGTRREINER